MDLSRYDNSDFRRGAPSWKEALWLLVRSQFFQTNIPWPSHLRVVLLRAFGAQVGEGVVIRANVNVSFPWRLTVGDHVWIGEDVGILSLAEVVIEDNVCISQRAYLCTGSHDYRREDFKLVTRPITVRTGSWIAATAFIAPGVEIGAGSVVAAGSVVTKNVPPGTLVRGNPAEVVKDAAARRRSVMRFLFLNQYAPPETPPTARLLGELADGLRAGGHAVEILSQRQSYAGRPATGGGRLRRELAAAWTILRAGLTPRGGRPDVILAFTSPPGLLVVGALLAIRHRARLAHWAMDLYPELALALGEMPSGSAAVRVVRVAMNWAYRRASLVVALDEDMRAHLQGVCRVPVRVMGPWPAPEVERQADAAFSPPADASGPWTWLYSGNLGRAHEWKTLLDAQALLEARGPPVTLVFQGDGAARGPATEYAGKLGLRRCEWKGYVPEDDLLPALMRARVLVVTQRPETRGLLWPSKLALLERLPRPILFVGPTDGDIARRLRERGQAGVFAPGEAEGLAAWVEAWHRGENVWDAGHARSFPTHAEKRRELERWIATSGRDGKPPPPPAA